MLLRVTDVETTGFPPAAEVIELGWTDVHVDIVDDRVIGAQIDPQTHNYRCRNTQYTIGVEAMSVHHIIPEDLVEAEYFQHVFKRMLGEPQEVHAFVAHNAKFEKQFLKTDIPFICTMKCSMQKFITASKYSNQYLRYFLGLQLDRQRAEPVHAAGPDTYVTAHILVKLLGTGMTIQDMIKVSGNPVMLPNCPLNKHKGKPWSEVPLDYLSWILRQSTMEEDIMFSARQEYRRRINS